MAQASPQVEDGYTRIANEFLEAFMAADYPASVLRFMLVVMRETWGWGRREARIPTKRFVDVFGGVTDRRIQQIRDDCLRHNLLEVDGGDQFDVPVYRIQKHYTDWLTWKSLKPWDPPHPPGPSQKEEVRTEPLASQKEDLPTPRKEEVRSTCEGEGSLFKESSKDKERKNDSSSDASGEAPPPEPSKEDQLRELRNGVPTEDLSLIDEYLDNAADKNQSGIITIGRRVNETRELLKLRDDLGEGPWRYGMAAANRQRAPALNYVKKAAGSWKLSSSGSGTRTYAAPQQSDAPEETVRGWANVLGGGDQ
jgi:phage replication O-like protein O